MLGIPLRYSLKHPLIAVTDLAAANTPAKNVTSTVKRLIIVVALLVTDRYGALPCAHRGGRKWAPGHPCCVIVLHLYGACYSSPARKTDGTFQGGYDACNDVPFGSRHCHVRGACPRANTA